jgi:hypothetical protein
MEGLFHPSCLPQRNPDYIIECKHIILTQVIDGYASENHHGTVTRISCLTI